MLGWAQTMPKFASDLINYVQTFLERTYERCRTSYMEVYIYTMLLKDTISCYFIINSLLFFSFKLHSGLIHSSRAYVNLTCMEINYVNQWFTVFKPDILARNFGRSYCVAVSVLKRDEIKCSCE